MVPPSLLCRGATIHHQSVPGLVFLPFRWGYNTYIMMPCPSNGWLSLTSELYM